MGLVVVLGLGLGLGLGNEVAVGAKVADQGMAFREAEVGLLCLLTQERFDPLVTVAPVL
jgi:hypothetical protein